MKRIKLFESFEKFSGKNFVVVDTQPEYKDYFTFRISDFTNFLNENYDIFNRITILYNGEWTLGMINEYEYKIWLIENGLNEEVLDYLDFYDKGYAFFRYCIDKGIDDEEIINLVKYMIEKNINDSRDLAEEDWRELIQFYKSKNLDIDEIKELLEYSDDVLFIPDLMDELKPLNNILITGGGLNECLKEVIIALEALDKKYSLFNRFIY